MGDTPEGEKGVKPMEEVEGVKKKSKKKESRYGKRYGFEVKLRRVGVSCGVRPAGYLDCPRFSDLTLLLPFSTVSVSVP